MRNTADFKTYEIVDAFGANTMITRDIELGGCCQGMGWSIPSLSDITTSVTNILPNNVFGLDITKQKEDIATTLNKEADKLVGAALTSVANVGAETLSSVIDRPEVKTYVQAQAEEVAAKTITSTLQSDIIPHLKANWKKYAALSGVAVIGLSFLVVKAFSRK